VNEDNAEKSFHEITMAFSHILCKCRGLYIALIESVWSLFVTLICFTATMLMLVAAYKIEVEQLLLNNSITFKVIFKFHLIILSYVAIDRK